MNALYCAEGRIETLKKRTRRCVCKYCGGALSLRRIIFHDVEDVRVEIYCDNCDRIEFGVEPEIYISACNFVDNLEFDCYEGLDANEKETSDEYCQSQRDFILGLQEYGIVKSGGISGAFADETVRLGRVFGFIQ